MTLTPVGASCRLQLALLSGRVAAARVVDRRGDTRGRSADVRGARPRAGALQQRVCAHGDHGRRGRVSGRARTTAASSRLPRRTGPLPARPRRSSLCGARSAERIERAGDPWVEPRAPRRDPSGDREASLCRLRVESDAEPARLRDRASCSLQLAAVGPRRRTANLACSSRVKRRREEASCPNSLGRSGPRRCAFVRQAR